MTPLTAGRPKAGSQGFAWMGVALALFTLSVTGCGVSLMGHSIGGADQGAKPVAASTTTSKPSTKAPKATAKAEPKRGKKDKPRPASTFSEKVAEARGFAIAAPTEPYWPYRAGELYASVDSMAAAETAFRTAVARDPAYAPALSQLSKLYFQNGRHAEAIELLESARAAREVTHQVLPAELLAGLALHYDALDRTDQARDVLASMRRGEREDAGSASVYLALRGVSPDSAGDIAKNVVRDEPKSAASQNNYGITLLRAGDPVQARKAFEAAIKLDPALPGPYYNLAILEKYYALDDDAAAKRFREYQKRSSDDPDGLAQVMGGAAAKPVAGEGE